MQNALIASYEDNAFHRNLAEALNKFVFSDENIKIFANSISQGIQDSGFTIPDDNKMDGSKEVASAPAAPAAGGEGGEAAASKTEIKSPIDKDGQEVVNAAAGDENLTKSNARGAELQDAIEETQKNTARAQAANLNENTGDAEADSINGELKGKAAEDAAAENAAKEEAGPLKELADENLLSGEEAKVVGSPDAEVSGENIAEQTQDDMAFAENAKEAAPEGNADENETMGLDALIEMFAIMGGGSEESDEEVETEEQQTLRESLQMICDQIINGEGLLIVNVDKEQNDKFIQDEMDLLGGIQASQDRIAMQANEKPQAEPPPAAEKSTGITGAGIGAEISKELSKDKPAMAAKGEERKAAFAQLLEILKSTLLPIADVLGTMPKMMVTVNSKLTANVAATSALGGKFESASNKMVSATKTSSEKGKTSMVSSMKSSMGSIGRTYCWKDESPIENAVC